MDKHKLVNPVLPILCDVKIISHFSFDPKVVGSRFGSNPRQKAKWVWSGNLLIRMKP